MYKAVISGDIISSTSLMGSDRAQLELLTTEFFNKYWNKELGDYPKWSTIWEFDGKLPNNEDKGCYAHFNGEEIVYIGVAISNSNKGSGIGSRVSNYWKMNPDQSISLKKYLPTKENLTGIITIPFGEHFYLAAALEVFLIQKLEPPPIKNKTHKK